MKRFGRRSLRRNNRQNILILHDMFVLIVMTTWKPVAKRRANAQGYPAMRRSGDEVVHAPRAISAAIPDIAMAPGRREAGP